jgi:hypothetical protein
MAALVKIALTILDTTHRQVYWDCGKGKQRRQGPRAYLLPLGLAAVTVSVTAAFLSSSSFSYPEKYGHRKR